MYRYKELDRLDIKFSNVIGSVGENGKEREDGFSGQHASMRQAFSSILNTDEAYIIIREE